MNNKKNFFSTAFCIFIAVLFILGCNNHLLKLQQEEAHLIVKIANSTGARNASTTGDWQISAWIENQDGSESHHQNLNSASGEETSLTFDDLVIGSQINIHLELTKNDDTQTKLTGTSGWKTIEEGVNVIIIVLREVKQDNDSPSAEGESGNATAGGDGDSSSTGENGSSDSGDNGENGDTSTGEGDPDTPNDPNSGDSGQIPSDTTAPLGSQTNPATTWADLVTIVRDSTTTDAIYIAGTPDASGLYTMEATSSIIISSNTTIIPTNNVTILRGSSFTDELFNVTGTLNLGNSSNSFIITLDGQNSAVEQPLVYSSGTLNMTNSVITKNNNSNDYVSPSSLFIFSGTTTLNNVSFSGNTSGLSGAADIYLHQGSSHAQLNLAESFAATEIYFSASMSTTAYPVIQLNQNLSLQDANKVKITVGSTTPENIQVVNKNGYTGDLNALFEVVGTNNTTYSLNDEGKVVENTQSSVPENGLTYNADNQTLTIYNEQGLKNFRDIVNGTLTQAITVDGKTFSGTDRTVSATLANNITLTGEWTPIGKSAAPYAGTFDGAGHTVSGISITSGMDKGFFGYIQSQATIANLIVEGNISGSTSVGGIVAHSKGGNINYCINKINVTNTNTGETGGIVGYISIGTTITGCVNFGTITGYDYTGGIVGQNTSGAGGTTIDRCINFGTITSTSSSAYIGGIYGYSLSTSDTITNSANFGSIVSSSHGAGIVNYDASNDTTQYCLNVGDMTGVTTPNKNYPIANTESSDLPNYYDSGKMGSTTVSSKGGTGKETSELKVDSAWDTSWTTTNWSFASGRYPVPNIQANIPSTIWDEIVEKAAK